LSLRALASESGLAVQLNENGSIRRIDCGGVLVNLFLGNEIEGGPANLYLRRLRAEIEWVPLLGPRSPARMSFSDTGFGASGTWQGIRFELSLRLARTAPAWFWHVELENTGSRPETLDLIWAQDVGLADYAAVRLNEYYVSHYVDHTPLSHPERGAVLAVRQNQPMGGRHPWLLVGSLGRAESFATDALQLHGLGTRTGRAPAALCARRLPGERLQHEHSMAVLQEAPLELAPGARCATGFFAWFESHHPTASSEADLAYVDRALRLAEAQPPAGGERASIGSPAAPTLFSAAPLLECLDLGEEDLARLFGAERREVERGVPAHGGGPCAPRAVLSFFTGADRHVVLRAKELEVLRPHGQILRTGDRLVPDETSLTSTYWMAGVFHSMLTQGHVSINRFLSTAHGYLGLFRAQGQRVFAELSGAWHLLDVPSACEMAPGHVRWIYKHARGMLELRSIAPAERHELGLEVRVLEGEACRLLISHHVAVGGDDGVDARPVPVEREGACLAVHFAPDSDLGRRFPGGSFRIELAPGTELERVGGDELLFLDGRSRAQPFLVLVTRATSAVSLWIRGPIGKEDERASAAREAAETERFWRRAPGPLALEAPRGALAGDAARVHEILPWLAHDALIHYLAPRGLEQYSGGGWGTRDVSQGPVELLLALGRWRELRDLLARVFRAQNPDGDWPQWFMFFERERNLRAPDSHGDVVFWPLLALAEYLLAAEDFAFLDEELPFFDARGDERAERATLWGHVERALGVIAKRVIPGTQLAAFGNGDWDDTLQPADPSMCERLCSAWTVALHYQTFGHLARALRRAGRTGRALELEASAQRIRADFERLLLPGGVLAGFAYFHPDGRVDPLLHPGDRATGIGLRLLPMMHAITADLFTPEEARTHVEIIRRHLLGPDGVRLFDRPHRYRGGTQRWFRRAETATYFGREIGLVYMHAHLRFAEAMAHYGDADAFFHALRLANPIGIRELVPGARPRQANCYYTSSDAAFPDRYAAQSRYTELSRGVVGIEGGWRVYSSGPGVALRLVHQVLVGLRRGKERLVIDPVVPRGLDGLRARLEIEGRPLEIEYRVRERGCGPVALLLDDRPLAFEVEPNPYRPGGAVVPMDELRERSARKGTARSKGRRREGSRLVVELR
jgi:cellobiose phosphorylase